MGSKKPGLTSLYRVVSKNEHLILLCSIPNHQRWHAKWKLGQNTYMLRTRFRMFGTDLHAQSVLMNKNFRIGDQSEVYSECVVGWVSRGLLQQSSLVEPPPLLAQEPTQKCNFSPPPLMNGTTHPHSCVVCATYPPSLNHLPVVGVSPPPPPPPYIYRIFSFPLPPPCHVPTVPESRSSCFWQKNSSTQDLFKLLWC